MAVAARELVTIDLRALPRGVDATNFLPYESAL